MKKIIVLVIFVLLLISCNKKEVHLPNIPLNGKEEVQNHSSIWLFNDNGKLDLNEKNRISSTHWFFNIDKELQLKEILPEVIRLRNKHNEKSPHNTKKMNNYFSYANSLTKKLSFYQFDSINYKLLNSTELPVFKDESDTILIKIFKVEDYKKLKNNKVVQLAFNNSLTFQDYLITKSLVVKDSAKVNLTEYIFD